MHPTRKTNTETERPPSKRSVFPKDDGEKSWRPYYIGAGVVAVVAFIGAVALGTRPDKKAKKTNIGLQVKPQCSGYTITDLMALRESLRKELAKAAKIGSPDPFQVTAGFLTQKRFACTVFPNQVRNPGEADLFAAVFFIVTELMVQERLASESQRKAFNSMVITWATSQGAKPQQTESLPVDQEEGAGGEPLA